MSTSEDRAKALDTALKQINKKHGENSAMRLGERPQMDIETISTGSLAIDIALGVGGLPKGRIIEIYGPESSGKTLFCLESIAAVQREGGTAAFIDAEHAFSKEWAGKVGVDVDNLIITQPDSGEQGLDTAEMLIRSGAVDIVVVDSVAALTPQKELEGEIGDAQMGIQARMMSQALRKITAAVNQTQTTVIFINQLREKIGVMFGSPETTTGGKALKFYASVRLDIRRIGQIKEGAVVVGADSRIKVVKNKVAPPFTEALFSISFAPGSEGFSREGDIITLGEKYGLVQKAGAWYRYGDMNAQGREKARVFLVENPDVAKELEDKILAIVFPERAVKSDVDGDASVANGAASLDAVAETDF